MVCIICEAEGNLKDLAPPGYGGPTVSQVCQLCDSQIVEYVFFASVQGETLRLIKLPGETLAVSVFYPWTEPLTATFSASPTQTTKPEGRDPIDNYERPEAKPKKQGPFHSYQLLEKGAGGGPAHPKGFSARDGRKTWGLSDDASALLESLALQGLGIRAITAELHRQGHRAAPATVGRRLATLRDRQSTLMLIEE
jgi:hypothetical protein